MPGFETIAWAPLAGGLTVVGLILSWVAWRRRGVAAGLRGVAWSLLPIAAYLTGTFQILGRIISAFVGWAVSFVFSPFAWLGIIVAGLSFVLFVVSGALRRRGQAGAAKPVGSSKDREVAQRSGQTGLASGREADDDLSDVEEILRRRGIR